MSRRAGAPAKRRFAQPTGPFVLLPHLAGPGLLLVGEAVEVVVEDWQGQAAAGGIDAETVRVHGSMLRVFARYAAAHKVVSLAEVDSHLVVGWLLARSIRDNTVPTASQVELRRSVVRTFFATVFRLGLTDANPAATLSTVRTPQRVVAPLSAAQIRALKDAADHDATSGRTPAQHRAGASRSASAVALALLGAQGGEVGSVRVRDVDLLAKTVWVHGGGNRHVDRHVPIDDPWCWGVLADRIAFLAGQHGSVAKARHVRLCYTPSTSPDLKSSEIARRRAAGATLLATAMKRAGIAQPGRNRVGSITDAVAARVFADTGSVEAVAHRLGLTSLDTAAQVVGYDWR